MTETETDTNASYELTEEQSLLQETVRGFALDDAAPRAAEVDRDARWPQESWRGMTELGLPGLSIPEVHGGVELDARCRAIALTELARGCGTTAATLLGHLSLCCGPIVRFGSDALQRRALPALAAGECVGSGAFLHGDVAVGTTTLRAIPSGDGYQLDGVAPRVLNAGEAKWFVIGAEVEGEGRVLFALERATAGVEVVAESGASLGLRGAGWAGLTFQGCTLPAEQRLAASADGLLELSLDVAVDVAAVLCGLSRAAFDRSLRYSTERATFGKPIARHQALGFKIADMHVAAQSAQAMLRDALLANGAERALAAWSARTLVARAAEQVAFDAIQVHGGYGYSAEYDVERIWRDVRTCAEIEGGADRARQRIIESLLA